MLYISLYIQCIVNLPVGGGVFLQTPYLWWGRKDSRSEASISQEYHSVNLWDSNTSIPHSFQPTCLQSPFSIGSWHCHSFRNPITVQTDMIDYYLLVCDKTLKLGWHRHSGWLTITQQQPSFLPSLKAVVGSIWNYPPLRRGIIYQSWYFRVLVFVSPPLNSLGHGIGVRI